MVRDITVTALITGLVLFAENRIPWSSLMRRELRLIERYVMGLMGINLPMSLLLVAWGEWWCLAALWSITITGGLAVIGGYVLDHTVETMDRMIAAEREAKMLRPELNDDARAAE